jgi:hypothetical protein
VLAVGFHICDVVEEIYRTGYQAKQEEAFERSQEWFNLKQLLIEDQSKEDKTVLCPLPDAHCFKQVFEHDKYFT